MRRLYSIKVAAIFFSVGFVLLFAKPVHAASWWLSGGISSSSVVAAYQPEGATSLSASYVNLADPGTDNVAPGVAPTWDVSDGWVFNGTTTYLTTGIVPSTAQTWTTILRFSNATGTSAGTLVGSYGSGGTPYIFAIQYSPPDMNSFCGQYPAGLATNSPILSSGVYAISGLTPYRNGTAEGTACSSAGVGGTAAALYYGALNIAGSPSQFSQYDVQAAATYNTTLTGAQVLAVTNAMDAITSSTASMSANVNLLAASSTGNSITLTGSSTSWTAGNPGSPTFTISGGSGASITGQTVASPTSATITVNAGNATGTLTITDPVSGATATVTVIPDANNITSFSFGLTGEIDTIGTSTIGVTVDSGTNVTALTPTIAISQGAAVSPVSGATENFTNPQTYTVTAVDGVTQHAYTVTVTVAVPVFNVSYTNTTSGVMFYTVSSSDNGPGTTTLRILEPNAPAPGVPHNFLYCLPVEIGLETDFGDCLAEVQALNYQNTYNLTVIAPSFSIYSWFADNDTDPEYRYQSFMTQQLEPWVVANLATSGTEQNWLLGFSKSGYGGMDLLLKFSNLFNLGAFWDFPADLTDYTEYGANTNYGTLANFQNNYELTSTFVGNHKTPFLTNNRMWIGGYADFEPDMIDFNNLLIAQSIQYTSVMQEYPAHSWTSGWMQSAVPWLYADSDAILDGLTVSTGTLSPSFASSTTSYTMSVGNNVTNMTFTPTADQASSTITVNGSSVPGGATSTPIALGVGANTILTVVTAPSGNTSTYTLVVTRAGSGSSGPIFSSGGGGSAYDLSINGGAASTATANVTLSLYGTEAYVMEVSETPSFASTTWIPYVTAMPWTLAPDLGTQTVYVQFRSVDGTIVGNAQASIDLAVPGSSTSSVSSTAGMSVSQMEDILSSLETKLQILKSASSTIPFVFTRDLQLYDTGTDVLMLQKFLNSKGFLLASQGPGSPGNETMLFGPRTLNALAMFQKSVGIVPDQGYFGPITRKYINNHV